MQQKKRSLAAFCAGAWSLVLKAFLGAHRKFTAYRRLVLKAFLCAHIKCYVNIESSTKTYECDETYVVLKT
jgi:hypothetical protein